jgi:hypothetical protein
LKRCVEKVCKKCGKKYIGLPESKYCGRKCSNDMGGTRLVDWRIRKMCEEHSVARPPAPQFQTVIRRTGNGEIRKEIPIVRNIDIKENEIAVIDPLKILL